MTFPRGCAHSKGETSWRWARRTWNDNFFSTFFFCFKACNFNFYAFSLHHQKALSRARDITQKTVISLHEMMTRTWRKNGSKFLFNLLNLESFFIYFLLFVMKNDIFKPFHQRSIFHSLVKCPCAKCVEGEREKSANTTRNASKWILIGPICPLFFLSR